MVIKESEIKTYTGDSQLKMVHFMIFQLFDCGVCVCVCVYVCVCIHVCVCAVMVTKFIV